MYQIPMGYTTDYKEIFGLSGVNLNSEVLNFFDNGCSMQKLFEHVKNLFRNFEILYCSRQSQEVHVLTECSKMGTSNFVYVMLYEEFVMKIVKDKNTCIQQPVWRLTLSATDNKNIFNRNVNF